MSMLGTTYFHRWNFVITNMLFPYKMQLQGILNHSPAVQWHFTTDYESITSDSPVTIHCIKKMGTPFSNLRHAHDLAIVILCDLKMRLISLNVIIMSQLTNISRSTPSFVELWINLWTLHNFIFNIISSYKQNEK